MRAERIAHCRFDERGRIPFENEINIETVNCCILILDGSGMRRFCMRWE